MRRDKNSPAGPKSCLVILDIIIIITLIQRYTRKNLQACGAVHYQHQNPLDNQKRASTINVYINIKMMSSGSSLPPLSWIGAMMLYAFGYCPVSKTWSKSNTSNDSICSRKFVSISVKIAWSPGDLFNFKCSMAFFTSSSFVKLSRYSMPGGSA